ITGTSPVSVVLTGTAGDGKTHLCRQVWEAISGDPTAWQSPEPYLCTSLPDRGDGRSCTLHVVRDLSAWVPQQGAPWEPAKEALLQRFSSALFTQDGVVGEVFLIAGNDGQLIESWRRLGRSEAVERAKSLFERLLMEDLKQ